MATIHGSFELKIDGLPDEAVTTSLMAVLRNATVSMKRISDDVYLVEIEPCTPSDLNAAELIEALHGLASEVHGYNEDNLDAPGVVNIAWDEDREPTRAIFWDARLIVQTRGTWPDLPGPGNECYEDQ